MSKILSLNIEANFYLYRKPVKMSRSFDGLETIIRTEMEKDILNGDIFIFLNKQRTMLKVFVYENKGYTIFYRRLDAGNTYQLPVINADDITFKMSAEQILYMLSGMTLQEGGYIKADKYVPLLGAAV
jgi:hypothetical protein